VVEREPPRGGLNHTDDKGPRPRSAGEGRTGVKSIGPKAGTSNEISRPR
jgi:hypothetical protein